jgi:hypothetical protein
VGSAEVGDGPLLVGEALKGEGKEGEGKKKDKTRSIHREDLYPFHLPPSPCGLTYAPGRGSLSPWHGPILRQEALVLVLILKAMQGGSQKNEGGERGRGRGA